ncbi:serine/threonine-protein kinase [Frankia sp. ACN10a]|uniref:serine/threonine-protein kinase n=1 Tax=Frankia sp. ACN10a TaxID=2926031 RepID=UPI002118A3E8|nr:serine/threonine-protein kinase [Frankia sp. ACN10a]
MLRPLTDTDPRIMGPYRLHYRIGAGGMGVVYLGFADEDRPVAVKVPHEAYASDPEFRARFRSEVTAARHVQASTVARVINAEVEGSRPWLATEYVPGPTLHAAVLEHGPLVDRHLDNLTIGLAAALEAIHDAGVVHRDLKPANIVMSWTGPKVIDFGVARSAEYTGYTQAGELVGTIAWMSPEQLDGQIAGPAADIFAWACCVVFAATGRRPFRGETQEIVALRIGAAEPDLDGTPDRLLDAVSRCLAKDPARRPAAGELVRLLSRRFSQPATPGDERTPPDPPTITPPPPDPPPPDPPIIDPPPITPLTIETPKPDPRGPGAQDAENRDRNPESRGPVPEDHDVTRLAPPGPPPTPPPTPSRPTPPRPTPPSPTPSRPTPPSPTSPRPTPSRPTPSPPPLPSPPTPSPPPVPSPPAPLPPPVPAGAADDERAEGDLPVPPAAPTVVRPPSLPLGMLVVLLTAGGLVGAVGIWAAGTARAGHAVLGPAAATVTGAVCAQLLFLSNRAIGAAVTVLAAFVGSGGGVLLARSLDVGEPGRVLLCVAVALVVAATGAFAMLPPRPATTGARPELAADPAAGPAAAGPAAAGPARDPRAPGQDADDAGRSLLRPAP